MENIAQAWLDLTENHRKLLCFISGVGHPWGKGILVHAEEKPELFEACNHLTRLELVTMENVQGQIWAVTPV